MKRIAWISCAALAVCLLTAGAASWWAQHRVDSALAQTAQLQRQVTELNNALLGYTRYTSYLTAGKQTLAEQMKLLAATVVREEGATQIIEKSVLGIASTGVVAITYTAEYAFGFDLRPESYELHATNGGIEVQAVKGFNVIATANDRDRGVNDMSAALKRRFNMVVLPSPATLETISLPKFD